MQAVSARTSIGGSEQSFGPAQSPWIPVRLTQLVFQKDRTTEIDETFHLEVMPMLTLKGTRPMWPSHGCCDQAAGHVI
jgi:hypothetical protein